MEYEHLQESSDESEVPNYSDKIEIHPNNTRKAIRIVVITLGTVVVTSLILAVLYYLWIYGYLHRGQRIIENTKEEIIQVGEITRYKDSLYGFDEGNNVYLAPGFGFESDIQNRRSILDFTRIEGLSARNFEVIGNNVGRVGDLIYFGGMNVTDQISDPSTFKPLMYDDELGVYFSDAGQIWFMGDNMKAITVANPSLYRELSFPNNWTDHHFVTDGTDTYLNADRVYIADPNTFTHIYPTAEQCQQRNIACEKIDNNWYKDSQAVYFNGIRVLDADPASFKIPQPDVNTGKIGVDKNYVYDIKTTRTTDRKYLDSCNSYDSCVFDLKLPGINPEGFVIAQEYGNGIFTTVSGTYDLSGKKISDAVTGEFEAMKIPAELCQNSGATKCSSLWTRDADHVYYDNKIVPGADSKTFEIIPQKTFSLDYDVFYYISRCGKDAKYVYCQLERVNNVDRDTFESLAENLYRDKDHIYVTYYGVPHTPVTELDVNTFEIKMQKNRMTGCDKNGCYWISKDSTGKSSKDYVIYKNVDGDLTLMNKN